MDKGWILFIAVVWLVIGVYWGLFFAFYDLKQSARAGVMVIDGTAYVLIPAKRGE